MRENRFEDQELSDDEEQTISAEQLAKEREEALQSVAEVKKAQPGEPDVKKKWYSHKIQVWVQLILI